MIYLVLFLAFLGLAMLSPTICLYVVGALVLVRVLIWMHDADVLVNRVKTRVNESLTTREEAEKFVSRHHKDPTRQG